ncbi:MFS transporter [Nocardioides sp.]|uniref:MFS transporter n=1 Tax=Nocardioides sp. TaxID=35761 RepID=UPI0026111E0D|nr:MFS transporter [Nocardioides sp.]
MTSPHHDPSAASRRADRVPRFLRPMIPPSPIAGRLAIQSMITRAGGGAFDTVSAVFLLRVVGIGPAQVGLAITIALVARAVAAYPVGRIVDALGPKRVWLLATVIRAVLFAAMPFIGSWLAYVAIAIAFEASEAAGESANLAYRLDVVPAEERITTQAYVYSAINIGFTIGALIGGVALGFSTGVVRWVPWLAAALMLANAWWIHRLPHAPHDLRVAERSKDDGPQERPEGPSAIRNVGWFLTSALNSTMWTNQVLLTVVIPLWLVARTDAPHVLLAWLFGTNTVLCIFVPPYLAKLGHTLDAALRAVAVSTGFFIVSCLITMVTHSTTGLWTIALVWLGHLTVTGAELAITTASWSFQAELMDPRRRGEYDGVANIARGVGSMWAPALFTWLAMDWDGIGGHAGVGWLVIAAIITCAGIGMRPSVRLAERFAARHFPEPATSGVE